MHDLTLLPCIFRAAPNSFHVCFLSGHESERAGHKMCETKPGRSVKQQVGPKSAMYVMLTNLGPAVSVRRRSPAMYTKRESQVCFRQLRLRLELLLEWHSVNLIVRVSRRQSRVSGASAKALVGRTILNMFRLPGSIESDVFLSISMVSQMFRG